MQLVALWICGICVRCTRVLCLPVPAFAWHCKVGQQHHTAVRIVTLAEFYRDHYRPGRLVGCANGTHLAYSDALTHWNRSVGLQIDSESGVPQAAMAKLAADVRLNTSAATANKTLRHVMALLRYAAEVGVLKTAVPKAVKLKEPRRLPEAWTVDQVQLILAETLREPGTIATLPANRWWYSLLLTIYYCGGRIGAVLATEPADLLLDERAIILRAAAQKQQADQYLHLPDQVIAAVAPIYSDRRRTGREGRGQAGRGRGRREREGFRGGCCHLHARPQGR